MAPLFLPVADLPLPGDLVWCKFPKRLRPNEIRVARPVLVRESEVRRDPQGMEFGVVKVTYGTDASGLGDRNCDFFIDYSEWKSLGLHKPTVFILDKSNTKYLLWCDEYFVPQKYLASQSLFIGSLSPAQMARLAEQVAKPRP